MKFKYAIGSVVVALGTSVGAQAKVTFKGQIKPLFEQKCGACHEEYLQYQDAVAARNEIYQTVVVDKSMPTKPTMTDQERALVAQWINDGALEDEVAAPAPAPQPAAPSVDQATAKAYYQQNCVECHSDKKIVNRGWPVLWGMNEGYFVKQMKAYKGKTRIDHFLPAGGMNAYVASTSDEMIKALGKYVSADACVLPSWGVSGYDRIENNFKKWRVVDARGGDVRRGQRIAESNSCMDCHGKGSSLDVTGQQTAYMNKTLLLYKSGHRTNGTMKEAVAGLSNADILDVSAYLNSLRSCSK